MKAFKKAVRLAFRFSTGEVVQTLEGSVTARPGDAVLTGTRGECWPIQREKFLASYDISEGFCTKKLQIVEAERMTEAFSVRVGWSDQPIHGKAGDYRLTYGPGDFGVVEASIFDETYQVVED